MRTARRQHRATSRPDPTTFQRGMAQVLAALHDAAPMSEAQQAAALHALEMTPYRGGPQTELPLALPDEPPQQ